MNKHVAPKWPRDQLEVERAVSEFRAGRPVLIRQGRGSALVCGVEALDDDSLAALGASAQGPARLLLQGPRLRHLGAERAGDGAIDLPQLDPELIAALSFQLSASLTVPVQPLRPIDRAALELARLAQVLPAVVLAPTGVRRVAADILRVNGGAILASRALRAAHLQIVGRAPVPLEGAPQTEFVVFRGGEGLRDQVAIIVGALDLTLPVKVRLHSACLTGDLLGSLKCDCGDQLRLTVRHLAENGGGILLYLDQEGRGNGLSNKIRAYRLQTQGFDTYDADAILGFDHDQRRFDFAARMLKILGVHRVELFTNNPEKFAALEAAGLEVAACTRVTGRATEQNLGYLATKRDRAGHFIDANLAHPARPAE